MKATEARLVVVRSHWFSDTFNEGKEECFPTFSAKWNGKEVRYSSHLDRYKFADGTWSDWRFTSNYSENNGLTDTAKSALRDACEPLAMAWLKSDDYRASIALAATYFVKKEIERGRYYTEALDKAIPLITQDQLDRLNTALEAREGYEAALARVVV